jgi:hypothetical protein
MWSDIFMKIRGGDPDVKLVEVQTSLAEDEARIVALTADRESKLLESEFLQDVVRIDRELETLRANIVIRRQREQKLQQVKREHDHARLVEAIKAEKAEIEKRIAEPLERARRIDEAFRIIELQLPLLLAADAKVFANWSDDLPDAHRYAWARASTIRELSSRPPQRQLHAGLVRAVADHGAFNLEDRIRQSYAEFLTALRGAALPELNGHAEEAA